MNDQKEPASQPHEEEVTKVRAEDDPAETVVARGNVHSRQHDEPELPPLPPLPH